MEYAGTCSSLSPAPITPPPSVSRLVKSVLLPALRTVFKEKKRKGEKDWVGARAPQMEILGYVARFFPDTHGKGCASLLAEKKGDQVGVICVLMCVMWIFFLYIFF